MSDSGPESIDRHELRERLVDHDGYMQRAYGDLIERFQHSKGLRRAILTRRYPEVAIYVEYLEAQQSVTDALRSAYANEGQIIIH